MTYFYYRLIKLTLLLIAVMLHAQLSGQDREKPTIPLDHFYAKPDNISPFRLLLSKIHFGLSTGYGNTFYRQDLSGYSVLQQEGSPPLLFDNNPGISSGSIPNGYYYWFNDVDRAQNVGIDQLNDFLVNADTTELSLRASGMSIPLMATVHIEFFGRYKIGGGFMLEYHRPGRFKWHNLTSSLAPVNPNFGSTFYKKYFLILGGKIITCHNSSFAVDAHIGGFGLSKQFNKEFIRKGGFINIGMTLEKNLSEYFSLFARPSFDIKKITLNFPESDNAITTNMNAFFIGLGVTYRVPELSRCFIKTCAIQVNHQHGNREYRSRKHPFYKKQNPHHGENYPRLFKYKKEGRNKLNPY